MKVILSRKGMDSQSGGMPSPILPDGTLLSLPIPDNNSNKHYGDFDYKGHSLQEIICQLKPNFDFSKNPNCHLDPDIYNEITGKPSAWKSAFGQCGLPAIHLDKLGITKGDIFLFYGMFQQTEYQADGRLAFVKSSPIRHIIYGYMRVGEVLKDEQEIKQRYPWHPHSQSNSHSNNRLYLPAEYDTFHYSKPLVLTMSNQNSRSLWQLPPFFAQNDISISWQGKNHPIMKDGFSVLNSAARGQEFVITANSKEQENNLYSWAKNLIQIGTNKTRGHKMERIITELCNDDLKEEVFINAQFILFAESGAMGEAGKVLIVTSGGSIFHANYCFGAIRLNKLYRSIPVLKACHFDTLGNGTTVPNEWNYEYLGAGNHLIIRQDVYAEFKELLGSAIYPDEIYLIWLDVAWNIIEKQNAGKSPLETKTAAELAILMNTAETSTHSLSKEECIEYDATYGYDIYEN